jgi:hypothetical protein
MDERVGIKQFNESESMCGASEKVSVRLGCVVLLATGYTLCSLDTGAANGPGWRHLANASLPGQTLFIYIPLVAKHCDFTSPY